jgi:hypothetical protein
VTLPRVTDILAAVGLGPDLGPVPAVVLEAARARGTAVHALIEAHHYGYLEDGSITPETAPYFSAYLKFLADSGHEPIRSEFEVVHAAWGYRGHPDRLGWLSGRRILLDWKTAEAPELPPAGLQLAAYRLAWNAMHPTEPVDLVAVLQLKADGTYRYHDLAPATYEDTFLAAVLVYRARQERGR